ncbi:iron-sulfur cluster repair di-iron protein [Wenyingzhuangia fucanilytica]|uniref:Iron-sulfur cluster repair di-iron protein n=1 Tax=Wenyingzhuangia fucanilytica TaxID=1790137 RepID=A0A1B1Y263_9FLAO|nr:iron-sulfur cluster repair di-iron protein [Wenyingzhuangia fucanilytica]ANW94865.1 iron-sulfur cluster repair di-iron protein [Wenyingzhuangia fucanilytica]
MSIQENTIIGELVAEHYQTASVFKSFKIDFCCNGNRSILEACEQKGIDVQQVLKKLNDLSFNQNEGEIDFNSWDLDLLAEYIQKKHHRYVIKTIPELSLYLKKVAAVHGEHHPELLEIRDLFLASAEELSAHLHKEENIVFPFIKYMIEKENGTLEPPFFGELKNPIDCMKEEHNNEGVRFRKIAELSDNYTPPAEACNTYKVSFAMLKEFEEDLHKHIHLENNILFPKAIELEKELQFV